MSVLNTHDLDGLKPSSLPGWIVIWPRRYSSSGAHNTILDRSMFSIDGIHLSPSKGERTKVRGSATIAAKSTQPSPDPLLWKGRGGNNCAEYPPERDHNSR